MKVHCINILLFALPLNILVSSPHKKPHTTQCHTPKIPITRLLYECELYAPANYDNDPQMKEVMDNFSKQTQEKLREYDDRMVEKRKQCKDKCDKEIQKIILKHKLEKQMEQQLTTLETKIDTDDIPTCVCEKSIADKMENFCLKCGMNVGGGVILSSGVLGGIGASAVTAWKPGALKAAIAAALQANAVKISAAAKAAGEAKGVETIIRIFEQYYSIYELKGTPLKSFFATTHYTEISNIASVIDTELNNYCSFSSTGTYTICGARKTLGLEAVTGGQYVEQKTTITNVVTKIVKKAKLTADGQAAEVTAAKEAIIKAAEKEAIEATSYNWYTTISYSVLAILIIVLIMVIIYLILRYRRKKKMKKKLQYIKLLEE
ncbi:PIR protein, putative [Plasmodium sp. gorilla clade G1]|nr:PIR protein, putative [Plasmodium sp. gorilla clade G1]